MSTGRLIAADYSEAMLRETNSRLRNEVAAGGLSEAQVPELLRCDVAQLPLRSDGVDGVHAGAALH